MKRYNTSAFVGGLVLVGVFVLFKGIEWRRQSHQECTGPTTAARLPLADDGLPPPVNSRVAAPTLRPARDPEVSEGYKEPEHDLSSFPIWRVFGHVTDEEGEPVFGAQVFSNASARARREGGRTDPSGAYELRLSQEEAQHLSLVAVLPEEHVATAAPCRFEFGEGASREVECDLSVVPGCRVRVVVTDEMGAPVAGAHVRVVDARKNWGSIPRLSIESWRAFGVGQVTTGTAVAMTESADDGVCDFGNAPCIPSSVTVWKEGFVPIMNRELGALVSKVDHVVRLTLARGESILGRVVDAEGNGIAGARVVVAVGTIGGCTISDSDGWFVVSGLGSWPSRGSLAVTHANYAAHYEMSRSFTPGVEVEVILEPGATMAFDLVDYFTRQRIDADVDFYRLADTMYSTIASESIWPKLSLHASAGHVELPHVTEDIETIWVSVRGYDPFFIVNLPTNSTRTMTVELWPTQPLRLRCVDEEGNAIAGCQGSGAVAYEIGMMRRTVNQFEIEDGEGEGVLAISSSDVPYDGQATIVVRAPGYHPEELSISKWDCLAGAEKLVVMHRPGDQ